MMTKNLLLIISFFVFFSCKKPIQKSQIQYLGGYWEIEKVMLPDGDEKEYKANETIDYFILKGTTGFRKKGLQQIDGTFLSNDVAEAFSVFWKDEICLLNYKTEFAKWEEEIVILTKEKLVLKNANDIEYHYKRPVLFTKK